MEEASRPASAAKPFESEFSFFRREWQTLRRWRPDGVCKQPGYKEPTFPYPFASALRPPAVKGKVQEVKLAYLGRLLMESYNGLVVNRSARSLRREATLDMLRSNSK